MDLMKRAWPSGNILKIVQVENKFRRSIEFVHSVRQNELIIKNLVKLSSS
jgi:hypothetical protein